MYTKPGYYVVSWPIGRTLICLKYTLPQHKMYVYILYLYYTFIVYNKSRVFIKEKIKQNTQRRYNTG